MKQFMEESKIKDMTFKPHFLLLWHASQTFGYLVIEGLGKVFRPIKTEDELFKCADGGTVGVAWSIDRDGSGRPTGKRGQKPILLLCPGLGGAVNNMYTTAMLHYAKGRGYKVGTVYFRCSEGIPITSPKINYAGAWDDLKCVIEYVDNKYVRDA